MGANAAELDSVKFEDRIIKMRKEDEEESEFEEGDEDGPKLVLEDEDSEEISDDEEAHEDKMEKLHKGIMVIKSCEEEVKIEAKKDDKEDGEDKKDKGGDADDDEEKKDKKVTRKYFRAYFPQWKHKVTQKRIFYETFIEVKNLSAHAAKDATPGAMLTADGDEEGGDKAGGPKAELIEENETIITTDSQCFILALIIKGLKGEQHKVIMFNPEKFEPLISSNRAGNCELEFNMNSHIRKYNQIFICQTEPNDTVTARQLKFAPDDEEDTALPSIQFTKPARGYAKDCWLVM